MADTPFLDASFFLPAPVAEDGTIAQQILLTVQGMRKRGELSSSLAWPPESLELLAMYAIDAKLKLASLGYENVNGAWQKVAEESAPPSPPTPKGLLVCGQWSLGYSNWPCSKSPGHIDGHENAFAHWPRQPNDDCEPSRNSLPSNNLHSGIPSSPPSPAPEKA